MLRDNQLHLMKSLHLGLSYSLLKPVFTFTSLLPPARNFIAALSIFGANPQTKTHK